MDIKSQVEKLLDIYKSCSCNGKYDKPIPHIIEEINKIYSKNKVTRRDKLEVKNLIEDWLIDRAIDTPYMIYLLNEYNIVTSLTYGRYDKYALPHQNLDLCMNNLHVIENYREIVENNIIENIVEK